MASNRAETAKFLVPRDHCLQQLSAKIRVKCAVWLAKCEREKLL